MIFIGVAPITQFCTCLIKIVTFQGGHLLWKKVIFHHKELLLKERINSLWEQILSGKRSSHFDAIEENPFDMCNFFSVLATPLIPL